MQKCKACATRRYTNQKDCEAAHGQWVTVDGNDTQATQVTVSEGLLLGSGGGGGGGMTTSGFAFFIKRRGQTFNQCMVANAANYSVGGVADSAINTDTPIGTSTAGQVLAGNMFTGGYKAFAGSASDAAGTAGSFTPALVNGGMGAVATFGRRTSTVISLNLASKGGLPHALSPATTAAAKSTLGFLDKALNLGLDLTEKAVLDGGMFLAETVGCAHTKSW